MIIENYNLIKQKRNNTCGYATASMILAYLEALSIDEDYLVDNEPFDERGITFVKLMEIYKKYLKKYKAQIIHEDQDKTLDIIKNSLKNKIPLHILYLTNNMLGQNEPVLHYSALIGYDEIQNSFIVADPYGSIKTIVTNEFFNLISFRNECLPEQIKKNVPSNIMIRFVSY